MIDETPRRIVAGSQGGLTEFLSEAQTVNKSPPASRGDGDGTLEKATVLFAGWGHLVPSRRVSIRFDVR
jgi:hypothetical protein